MTDGEEYRVEESWFDSSDSNRLFCRSVTAKRDRAAVVLVHGVTEHSGRYETLALELASVGYSVFMPDLRGHGKSPGMRGDVKSLDEYVLDLGLLCEHVSRRRGKPPEFLLGHSMGCLVILRYAARHGEHLSGIVLAAPPVMIGPAWARCLGRGARILSRFFPRIRVNPRLKPSSLSSDPEVARKIREDPLMLRRISLRLAVEIIVSAHGISEWASQIQVPALLLQGSDDPIVDPRGIGRLEQLLPRNSTVSKNFRGLRHELFQELPERRREVVAFVIDWLNGNART